MILQSKIIFLVDSNTFLYRLNKEIAKMIYSDESKPKKQTDEDIKTIPNKTKQSFSKNQKNRNKNDVNILNINNQMSTSFANNTDYQRSPFIENIQQNAYQLEQHQQMFNTVNNNSSNVIQKQNTNRNKANNRFLNVNYTPVMKPMVSLNPPQLNPNTMIFTSPMIDGKEMNQQQHYLNRFHQTMLSPITDYNYNSTPNITNIQSMNFSPNVLNNPINTQQHSITNENYCYRTPKQPPLYHQHFQHLHLDHTNNSNFNPIPPQPEPNFISSLTPNISNTTHNNNRMYMLSPYLDPSTMTPNTNNFNVMNMNININMPSSSNQQSQHQQNSHLNFNNSVFSGNSINSNTTVFDEALLDNMLTKQSKNKKSKKPKQNTNTQIPNNNELAQSQMKLRNKMPSSTFIPQALPDNEIYIESILLYKDPRTTLMIKNIPNKYTISTFLEEINIEFRNKYDIFYLPIDYGNKCNLGFAFINFVEPMHIIHFYELYRGKRWKRFNSEKICELVYAKIQGKKELIGHFEKGKVLQFESEEKRPLILPTPHPLPQVKIPIKMFDKFIQAFPYAKYGFEKGEGINNQMDFFTLDNFYPC